MDDFSIVITTFSKRFGFLQKLIKQIRTFSENKIILVINGENNGDFIETYRKEVLTLCIEYQNIYPTFFIETRGLSKLWNTGIITSPSENVLILNDDIEIKSESIFHNLLNHIKSNNFSGLTKINGSFSHFIVNKNLIDNLGYFDERLLGFGEEDGDITFRLLKNGVNVNTLYVDGVVNIVSDVRHDHIKPGIGKYSNFNREFIYKNKYKTNFSSNYRGMFDTPMDQILDDINQYPYEKFFKENKNNL